MNVWLLVWNYLKARPLNTLLNTVLLGTGIAMIAMLLIISRQLEQKAGDNTRGIDLVVGAKGSPMQIILCSIFHIDFPTGNISLVEADRIARNRLVKNAVPLALGDSYQGYRIVGTSAAYPMLYKAGLREGTWWRAPMEVTVGARVADALSLRTGARFHSAHGLGAQGRDHAEHDFVVSGVMRRSNTVVDNLILTSVESIWQVHDLHQSDTVPANVESRRPSVLVPGVAAGDSTLEITSLLLQYRSPMGAVQIPRWVNSESNLQAASPAIEAARLFSILGVGVDIISALGYVLILMAALSIFIALYNSLKERRYDLAIMRTLGASRMKIFVSIVWEGSVLTALGTLLGVALAHGLLIAAPMWFVPLASAGISGREFYPEEWLIVAGGVFLGGICAMLPAVQAYRTDISRILAGD